MKIASFEESYFFVLFLFVLLSNILFQSSGCSEMNYIFPEGFLLGTASAAYQIEGGWDTDGKGHNIWDTLTHTHPDYVDDEDNGDIACDSYHKYKEDVQLLSQMKVDFYRFSISWSRILPTGLINNVNQRGIDYYNNLIDELLANDIKPMVTMYHWDLPQALQDLGGWPNLKIADYFEDYAQLLFTMFGDRVKWWITFNEPPFVSGYATAKGHAPCVNQPGIGDYLAAHTILLSHAKVYHLYDRIFRAKQQGKVGITLNSNWCEPLTNSTEDIESCDRHRQFNLGLYSHPIFSAKGDYPPVVKERIANNSKAEGFTRSRLPKFSTDEIQYIRGTYDFFGLNFYTADLGRSLEEGHIPSLARDSGVVTLKDPEWPPSASSWLKVVPWAFRKQLKWIAHEYNNPPVFVTENGFSDNGELNDTGRINYLTSHMKEMLKAIYEDGCNVIGYAVWSLLDNFEWNRGYTERFGLYHVDFQDPTRPRTAKESSKVFKEIMSTRKIPERFR
ncbi:myrosinase 1-like isoform X2 [Periplaneta americana]|uniref:myrosinase 1-like isoform X2 n=1 Tax=Periplaneta americana TaxID=6978 RepID=UPI0037E89C02